MYAFPSPGLWLRAIAIVLAIGAGAAAAEPVTVERESPLYAEPRLDAPPVALLAGGAAAEVVGKQGAWLQLRTSDASGWLLSFNVRFASRSPSAGAGAGAALGRLFGPQQGPTVTSSIGIRGLDEEDLRQAVFDAEQIERLERYGASKPAAEERARAEGLASAQVPPLEVGP